MNIKKEENKKENDDGEIHMTAKQSIEIKTDDICLWIDDYRKPPLPYNAWAKTYDEAIKFLNTGRVVIVSFDHDLGEGKNGYDITKYVEENTKTIPKFHCRFHTSNPVGRNNMKMAMQKAYELWGKKE